MRVLLESFYVSDSAYEAGVESAQLKLAGQRVANQIRVTNGF
jgi:hypothetical protein